MKTTSDLLARIAPEHATRPKFRATVGLSVDPFVRMRDALYDLIPAFDLDTAVGVQLDAVGVRVGCSRDIPVAIENINFSWDVSGKGWDQGSWDIGLDSGTTIVQLGDDDYRRLLHARVLSNRFDGTAAMAQQIIDTFFDDPQSLVFVEDDGVVAYPRRFFAWDNPDAGWDSGEWVPASGIVTPSNLMAVDMTATVGVSGKRPPLVYLALLGLGLLEIKPSAVRLDYLVTSVDETALFGFDMESDYVSGWDVGSWGIKPYDPLSSFYETPEAVPGSLNFQIPGNPFLDVI